MNIGPDNFGNGSSKTDDRFSGQLGSYRPGGRRDAGLGDGPIDDLSPRNGSLDSSLIGGPLTPPKLPESSLVADLGPLTEPMFGRDPWLDSPSPTGSLADHPLLRGLLMELPPKGTLPQQEWLDRWFEAARSILELIYSQEARPLK
ncbi:hypothetical protein ACFFX1_34755 [Dactylosporangium sucinum]|uniref:Uncharacterized protein n=1 Tax=Dactylosporangium sucinum TaxID=1424081 RepID=A0A917U2K1_9ACTN|nr:hypothetical protein [Dactylosporangium sucinum]GGM50768.1 hypothetical protein GCM10007977_060650 [Dactylosporangium sucinum]